MPRKRKSAQKSRPSSVAKTPSPSQDTQRDYEFHNDDGEVRHGAYKLVDLIDDMNGRLPRLLDEITGDLAAHGITVDRALLRDLPLEAIDLSSIDPKAAAIAELMLRLGAVVTECAWRENEAYRLLPTNQNSKTGTQIIQTRAAAAHSVIRREFAELLRSERPISLSDLQIATELTKRLSRKGTGFSDSSVRRQIGAMRKEVIAMSKDPGVSSLSASARIDAIVAKNKGLPGYSWETVRYFLHRPK